MIPYPNTPVMLATGAICDETVAAVAIPPLALISPTAQATAQADRQAIVALLEDLYQRYYDELRDYLLHLVQEAPLADDLAQQVFLHALAARRPITAVRQPRAWLYRIAINLVTEELRRRRMRARVAPETPLQALLTDPPDETLDLDTLLQQTEVVTGVRATLARLPTHYRIALLLYYGCDASYEEIADQTQSSPSGIKMLLTRARRAFRACYPCHLDSGADDGADAYQALGVETHNSAGTRGAGS